MYANRHWAMVVGGRSNVAFSDVELVSLDPTGSRPVPECLRRRADFPELWYGAVGGADANGGADLYSTYIVRPINNATSFPIVKGISSLQFK